MSVLVNKATKVICQGFTGNQGTFRSKHAVAYRTLMRHCEVPYRAQENRDGLPASETKSKTRENLKRNPNMTKTLALLLITLTALSGCIGGRSGVSPAEVCAEQSRWAESGTTEPGLIRITCPEGEN
jgi:hypothetical protein